MSEKCLLDQWRDMAYDRNLSKEQLESFWGKYFTIETSIYEQLLDDPDTEVKGTVKELAEKYGQDVMTMVGFLDGINDSLKTPNPIETMDEDTEVSLGFDKEKLYKNMVDARADWLYELPQWEKIFDENTRKRLYKEQKNSGTIRKEKKIGRNDPCWCGSGKKYKDCHLALDEKINSYKLKGWKIPPKKIIKRPDQIDGIRESGLVNIAVLDYVAENIHAGMSTEDIDRLVAEKTKELGGIAAPLNYEGFPKSVCTSINDAVCHGIPNEEEILQDGDIINVDVSTIYKGYFSDSSRMFCIGEVDDVSKKLVEDTLKAVQLGLSEVRPFNRLGNVGAVINEFAQSQGYKVVRDIGGHGVGLEFHEDPFVSYVTRRDTGMLLVPGMVFTIEPMINLGTDEIFIDSDNDWTVYTEDGAPSAQWEVTVAVTEDGYEILAY